LSLGIKVLNEILTVNIAIEENQDLKLASAASEEVHLLPEDPTKIINIVFIPMKTTWITLPKGKGHFMVSKLNFSWPHANTKYYVINSASITVRLMNYFANSVY